MLRAESDLQPEAAQGWLGLWTAIHLTLGQGTQSEARAVFLPETANDTHHTGAGTRDPSPLLVAVHPVPMDPVC